MCVCVCVCVCLYATDLLRMSKSTVVVCLLPRAYISLLDDDAIETEDPDLQNTIEASLESASESIRCARLYTIDGPMVSPVQSSPIDGPMDRWTDGLDWTGLDWTELDGYDAL